MTNPATSNAGVDAALDIEIRDLIWERLRGFGLVALAGMALSLVVDLLPGAEAPPPQVLAKIGGLVSAAFALTVQPALRRMSLPLVSAFTIVFAGLVAVVPLVGGLVSGHPERAAFVLSFVTLALATFLPWGGRFQSAAVILVVCEGAIGFMWSGQTVSSQTLVAVGSAAAASMYLAVSFAGEWRARRYAEIAVTAQTRALQAQTAELVLARDQALASTRAKSDFLANMSHELRTPLNGVIGFTDILLEGNLDEEQRDLAARVRRCGDTLVALVDDVLDLSRIEAGILTLTPASFDLAALVDEVVATATTAARTKGLRLSGSVGTSCPEWLEGDRGRIRQVLANLVGNAVKFTTIGEVTLTAACLAETARHATLRFAVCDTGPGIPAHVQATIFDRFVQADGSATRTHGGVGLGLAISRQLVEIMDGRIGVISTPGAGSTFWVELSLPKVESGVTAASA